MAYCVVDSTLYHLELALMYCTDIYIYEIIDIIVYMFVWFASYWLAYNCLGL